MANGQVAVHCNIKWKQNQGLIYKGSGKNAMTQHWWILNRDYCLQIFHQVVLKDLDIFFFVSDGIFVGFFSSYNNTDGSANWNRNLRSNPGLFIHDILFEENIDVQQKFSISFQLICDRFRDNCYEST